MVVLQALLTVVVLFVVCIGIPLGLFLLGFVIVCSTIDRARRRKARRHMSSQERKAEEEVFQLEKMFARS
jgi:cytochrome c-type biogenesis protein CcmH/NrfF